MLRSNVAQLPPSARALLDRIRSGETPPPAELERTTQALPPPLAALFSRTANEIGQHRHSTLPSVGTRAHVPIVSRFDLEVIDTPPLMKPAALEAFEQAAQDAVAIAGNEAHNAWVDENADKISLGNRVNPDGTSNNPRAPDGTRPLIDGVPSGPDQRAFYMHTELKDGKLTPIRPPEGTPEREVFDAVISRYTEEGMVDIMMNNNVSHSLALLPQLSALFSGWEPPAIDATLTGTAFTDETAKMQGAAQTYLATEVEKATGKGAATAATDAHENMGEVLQGIDRVLDLLGTLPQDAPVSVAREKIEADPQMAFAINFLIANQRQYTQRYDAPESLKTNFWNLSIEEARKDAPPVVELLKSIDQQLQ